MNINMSTVGLMYVGAVLFINGLSLLKCITPKSAGIFNIFVGVMQVITPFHLIFSTDSATTASHWLIFNDAGIFLFGFTYLYVGITNLTGIEGSGVGWYSLWVSILAIGYGCVNFALGDEKHGIIWLMWSFLWLLFFIQMGLKRQIDTFTGWVALIQSWITATIPAFLTLIGQWNNLSPFITWGVTIASVVAYIWLYFYIKSKSQKNTFEGKFV
ncbi:AmiS/UreI family transporter [Scopulibacillus darangshiensis]|uniref:AmiS/UreI family transporter n=1 Tax=Scopulibacillus darangshiensis TaxID=442528 RepID=A0A4R2P7Q0_9BACL|nr:AmiS/UreI family transporter [Scopulibacillus darangshiensis]TCP30837.1 AmiS/UreI family transporter [Scopulibacillus darangshiensis]